jgi:Zn-dependent peptidase ImmA (M78 family)
LRPARTGQPSLMRPIVVECRKIAKKYGIKVYFRKLKGAVSGQSDYENGIVIINSFLSSRQETLSCLFHEIGHYQCHIEGKWKHYHETTDVDEKVKCALKAEKWCDRWAMHELYQYDKRIRYLGSYLDADDKESREFLKKYYTDSP